VWTTEDRREMRFREVSTAGYPDYFAISGHHPLGTRQPYLIFCLAQIRGKLEPGFVMQSRNADALHAQWSVAWPKGAVLRIRFALTEMAVKSNQTGLKLVLTATDDKETDHRLFEQTIKPNDATVYDKECRFDYAVRKLTIVHDGLSDGLGDTVWIQPEIRRPK
jgi:hypothetical protein